MTRPWLAAAAVAAGATAAAIAGGAWWMSGKADRALALRLQERAAPPLAAAQPCQGPTGRRLVVLALGQSNAGNHGAETEPPARGDGPAVTVFSNGRCGRSGDPLAGGTGQHRSIWSRLEAQLERRGLPLELVVALLAVDSTTIDDWTRDSSPLKAELTHLLQSLVASSLKPDLVVWQQGESDARQGTSMTDYERRFEKLLAQLRGAGVQAPVLMARSTRCRNQTGQAVIDAQARLAQRHALLQIGPDTDALAGDLRHMDCHFSRSGLDAAASAWADAIVPVLIKR